MDMHCRDWVIHKVTALIMESSIWPARLPIVTIECTMVSAHDNDFIGDYDASVLLVLALRSKVLIVEPIVTLTNITKYSLLDSLTSPEILKRLTSSLLKLYLIIDKLLLRIPDEQMLTLIHQLDHISIHYLLPILSLFLLIQICRCKRIPQILIQEIIQESLANACLSKLRLFSPIKLHLISLFLLVLPILLLLLDQTHVNVTLSVVTLL